MVRKRNKKKAKYITIAFLTAAVVFGALSITYAAETPLHDVDPGTVVTFSGREWIVLEQMPNGETYLILKEPTSERAFDSGNNDKFDPTNTSNVGYYLNNNFYNSLSQKELIAEHSWDRICYDGGDAWDYGDVMCKVGLLSYREYHKYSTYYDGSILPSSYSYNWWTRTAGNSDEYTLNGVWYVYTSGRMIRRAAEADNVSVRPALYLQAGLVVDDHNNVGEGSTPPGPPAGLNAVAESPTSVKLTWSANTEDDLAGYKIYRDGVVIATVGKVTSYLDTTASPGTTYTYEVAAYNTSNQEGPKSNPATVTTPTGGNLLHDVEPGTVVTFSGREWIVLEQMPNGETYLILKEPDCDRVFDPDNTNLFNPTDSNNIAYYLNNDFYNSLSQRELIAEHSWDRISVDEYRQDSTDYGSIPCKVGLISYREYEKYSNYHDGKIDLDSNDFSWWTRTPTDEAAEMANIVAWYVDRYAKGTFVTQAEFALSIRPTIYLKAGTILDQNNTVVGGEVPPATPPGPPAGLSAVAESPTSVKLTWSANTEDDLAGYKIYRDGVVIATVGKVTSYLDTTASPGTTYTYEVAAYNTSNQEGQKSNPATVTTPVPPAALGAMWKGDHIEVVWSAGSTQLGNQAVLWRQMENGPWQAIKTLTAAEKSAFTYLDRNVAMGLNCRYEIRENGGITNFFRWAAIAESGWATGDRPLNAPSGLHISTLNEHSATVTWNAVNGAISYIIEYSTGGGTWQTQTSTGTTASVPRGCQVKVKADGTYSHYSSISVQ